MKVHSFSQLDFTRKAFDASFFHARKRLFIDYLSTFYALLQSSLSNFQDSFETFTFTRRQIL